MSPDMIPLLTKALGETVYMVAVSMVIATAIGVPLGVLLHTTAKNQILECLALNRILGAVVNAVRSIPFIILMVAIIPLTRLIVGSSIGTTAAITTSVRGTLMASIKKSTSTIFMTYTKSNTIWFVKKLARSLI